MPPKVKKVVSKPLLKIKKNPVANKIQTAEQAAKKKEKSKLKKEFPTLKELVSLMEKILSKKELSNYNELKKEYPEENLFKIYSEYLNDFLMDEKYLPKPPKQTRTKVKLFNDFVEYAIDDQFDA